MGKPKKGKKSRQEDDFGDDDADVDPLAQLTEEKSEEAAPKPVGKKGKKGKKGRKDDDWEDDVATEIAALNLDDKGDDNITNGNGESNTQSKNKKKKKGKKVRMDISDDEEEDMKEEAEEDDIMALAKASSFIKPKKSKSGMSAFQMLAMDDDDDDDDSQSEEEVEEVKPTQKKKDKNTQKQESIEDQDSDLDEVEEKPVPQTQPKQDKKKKKKEQNKPKKADEEDIDAVLAELEKPVEKEGKKKKKKKKGDDDEEHKEEGDKEESSGGLELKDMANMTQEEIAAMLWQDDEEEDDKKKRKKKKGKAAVKVEKEEDEDQAVLNEDKAEAEEDEEVSTVKTAAQKKKEKRERQKLQKQMEKEKGKKKDTVKKEDSMEAESESVPAESPAAEAPVEAEEKEEEEESSKKKKKDKKKKKTKEEKDAEEKAKKKPKSAHIKAMQEALQKMKEEEERLQQEEEEKEQRIEEARKAREEREKIEKEKRERDKQKKKDKIAKQKAEGTYMTAKQREQQKRAQQMLEAMKAQGIEVPQAGSKEDGDKPKKRIVYDSRPRKKKNQQSRQGSEPPTPTSEELPKLETPSPKEEVEKKIEEVSKTEVKKEVKKEVDSWEEVADAWDQSDEEEKEEEEHMITEKTNSKDKPEKAEEIEEDEEEDEEDEEDGDEEEDSSDDESEEESSSEEEQEKLTPAEKIERIKEKVRTRIQKKHEAAEAKRTTDELRAPIVCVLGHVDTGKTKILDKLRKSNVQDGEAGGITQQIGATNVPEDAIKTQTKMCKDFAKKELNIPGLLIIDTPGHESFSNLRNRGSSLCDIAVLVVDIMHGLEPQTIESISLLKKRKTPFIVALNKVDRLFQWQSNPHSDIVNTIKKQKPNTKVEFDERAQQIIVQFAEQGLNVSLFYENKNPREYISMIPTSAISGDGMGNLIAVLCDLSQTMLAKRLSYSEELQAITMEVKAIPGLGTTIDVILVNGNLKEGQTVVLAGTEGPIVTQIRGLLMPQPLRELRVKSAYEKFKEIKAAQGVKIIAKDLDKALAGLPMYVAHQQDEILVYREEVEEALEHVLNSIKVVERGVFVQASTLGSMEALLEFLKTSKIPYAGINIGPIHRKDVMKASIMLEHDDQYAVILAFDVKVEREAQEMADSLGVRIFTADIIYHLFDQFMAYRDDLKHRKQEEFKHIAVFPCKLRVLPQYIFNSRDPIVIGVQIEAGFIKVGTPICVPSKGNVDLGRITSLELNHKSVEKAVKGQEVCIKIEPLPGDTPKLYGRHFEHTDFLYSKLTRESIDAVKNYFRDEMTKTDWQLVVEMKKLFQIL